MSIQLDENKTFNPFPHESDHLSLIYSQFEKLRTMCTFYQPSSLSKLLYTKNEPSQINILHLNIRSIVNKADNLQTLLKSTNIKWHVICISETWLSKELESYYGMHKYKPFFKSRINKLGGGSVIYVNESFFPQLLKNPPFSTAEVVCIETELKTKQKVIICQIYKSPNTNVIKFLEELEECLIWLHSLGKTTFIAGDFNLDLFSMNKYKYAHNFFTMMCCYGFFPLITKTTRQSENTSSLIDNIFSNNLNIIETAGVIINDISDHFPVFASVNITANGNEYEHKKYKKTFDYRRIDEFKHFLQNRLASTLQETDPEIIATHIIEAYQEGIQYFSITKQKNRKSCPRRPWITPAVLASINRKNELFYQKIKNPSSENTIIFQKYRGILKNVLRKAKQIYYESKFKENQNNPKKTWNIISELMGKNTDPSSSPQQLKNDKDETVVDDKNKAEILNTFFSEIGIKLKNAIIPTNFDPLELIEYVDNKMKLDSTTENEIKNIIDNLNNVGAGHDQIDSKLFKSSYESIKEILLHLFNRCLSEGIFPKILKIAVIKPIYKNGDIKEPNNYRPISMLPYISKVLEKIISNRLTHHLNENDILDDHQFGFRKGRSTYMPLVLLQDTITKSFENSEHCLGIYLDLRKAFDTVNIDILLKKLQKYGIINKSFDIIKSYLSERKQCVRIEDAFSQQCDIQMGVPQGSILGPILFSLYINDLPKISSKMTCLLYADDTAIILNDKNPIELQKIIDDILPLLSRWLSANYLSLNMSKTYFQYYNNGCTTTPIHVIINDTIIMEKEEILYLGVTIDKSLKFSSHIKNVARIISRNIGVISRIRYFINTKNTYILYNAMILPYLNYCCLLWGINYASQLNRLVILQKRAVRLIMRVYPPASSEPIFQQFNILKINEIATIQMILVMHKYLLNELPESLKKLYNKEDIIRNRRMNKHLKEPFSNRNYRQFTTTLKGPKLWNSICAPHFSNINEITRSKSEIKKIYKAQLFHK